MRNKKLFIAVCIGVLLQWAGCKGDPPPEPEPEPTEVVLEAFMVNDGIALALQDAFFDAKGNHVKLVALKFYLANISLKKSDGSYVDLAEIELFDFKPVDDGINTPQWEKEYTYEVPAGDYTAIRFGVGVPGSLNGLDPASYNNDEALSIYSNMYWSWASMYRFIILEAQVDTLGGVDFSHDLIFHTGLDELYREAVELPISFNLAEEERKQLRIEVDWNKLFHHEEDAIPIQTRHITHTTDNSEEFDLAEKFTDNWIEALSVK